VGRVGLKLSEQHTGKECHPRLGYTSGSIPRVGSITLCVWRERCECVVSMGARSQGSTASVSWRSRVWGPHRSKYKGMRALVFLGDGGSGSDGLSAPKKITNPRKRKIMLPRERIHCRNPSMLEHGDGKEWVLGFRASLAPRQTLLAIVETPWLRASESRAKAGGESFKNRFAFFSRKTRFACYWSKPTTGVRTSVSLCLSLDQPGRRRETSRGRSSAHRSKDQQQRTATRENYLAKKIPASG